MENSTPNIADARQEQRRNQAKARRLIRRAESLAEAGRMEEAIVCQNEVTALRPDDPVAFFQLGLLYREMHRMDSAVTALQHATHLDPGHPHPREALIGTLLEAGRFDETVTEGRALVKMEPRSLFARDALGVAYLHLDRVGQAIQIVQEMIRLDPLNPAHYLKQALLYQQKGDLGSAVKSFVRAVEAAPVGSDVLEEAQQALEGLDEYQMRQIAMLAAEDRLFRLKLCQDSTAAATERGFCLSPIGLARLNHLAQEHLSEIISHQSAPASGNTSRYYH